jgi:hypothetical protein
MPFGSLIRVRDGSGRCVETVVADRGFSSAVNSRAPEESGTYDALRPRHPRKLSERMKDQKCTNLQRRRAKTEGRIGILKCGFLGRPMRAKGFEHREVALAWGVLTQNLWMLA